MSVYPNEPSSPTDILTHLPAKFEEARRSGQLFFFPSNAKDIYSKDKRVCDIEDMLMISSISDAVLLC